MHVSTSSSLVCEYILLGILKNMMFHSQVGDSLRTHFSMTFPQAIILQAGTIFLDLGPFPFQIKTLWGKRSNHFTSDMK